MADNDQLSDQERAQLLDELLAKSPAPAPRRPLPPPSSTPSTSAQMRAYAARANADFQRRQQQHRAYINSIRAKSPADVNVQGFGISSQDISEREKKAGIVSSDTPEQRRQKIANAINSGVLKLPQEPIGYNQQQDQRYVAYSRAAGKRNSAASSAIQNLHFPKQTQNLPQVYWVAPPPRTATESSNSFNLQTPLHYLTRYEAERRALKEELEREQKRYGKNAQGQETLHIPQGKAEPHPDVIVRRVERDAAYLRNQITRAQQAVAVARPADKPAAQQQLRQFQQRLQGVFNAAMSHSGVTSSTPHMNRILTAFGDTYGDLERAAYNAPLHTAPNKPLTANYFSKPGPNEVPTPQQALWMLRVDRMQDETEVGVNPFDTMAKHAPELKGILEDPRLSVFFNKLRQTAGYLKTNAQLKAQYGSSDWEDKFLAETRNDTAQTPYNTTALKEIVGLYRKLSTSYVPVGGSDTLTAREVSEEMRNALLEKSERGQLSLHDLGVDQTDEVFTGGNVSSFGFNTAQPGQPGKNRTSHELFQRTAQEALRTGRLDMLRGLTWENFKNSPESVKARTEIPSVHKGSNPYEDDNRSMDYRPAPEPVSASPDDYIQQIRMLAAVTPTMRNYYSAPLMGKLLTYGAYRGKTKGGKPIWDQQRIKHNQRTLDRISQIQERLASRGQLDDTFFYRLGIGSSKYNHAGYTKTEGGRTYQIAGSSSSQEQSLDYMRQLNELYADMRAMIGHAEYHGQEENIRHHLDAFPARSHLADMYLQHFNAGERSNTPYPRKPWQDIFFSYKDEMGYPRGAMTRQEMHEQLARHPRVEFNMDEVQRMGSGATEMYNFLQDMGFYTSMVRNGQVMRDDPRFVGPKESGEYRALNLPMTDQEYLRAHQIPGVIPPFDIPANYTEGDQAAFPEIFHQIHGQEIPHDDSEKQLSELQRSMLKDLDPNTGAALDYLHNYEVSHRRVKPNRKQQDTTVMDLGSPGIHRYIAGAQRDYLENQMRTHGGIGDNLYTTPLMTDMRQARKWFDAMRYGLLQHTGSNLNDTAGEGGMSLPTHIARIESMLYNRFRKERMSVPSLASPEYDTYFKSQPEYQSLLARRQQINLLRDKKRSRAEHKLLIADSRARNTVYRRFFNLPRPELPATSSPEYQAFLQQQPEYKQLQRMRDLHGFLYADQHREERGRIVQTLYALHEALGADTLKPRSAKTDQDPRRKGNDWKTYNAFLRAIGKPLATAHSRGMNRPRDVQRRVNAMRIVAGQFFRSGSMTRSMARDLLINGLGHSKEDAEKLLTGTFGEFNHISLQAPLAQSDRVNWSTLPTVGRTARDFYRPGQIVTVAHPEGGYRRVMMAPLVPWSLRDRLKGYREPGFDFGHVSFEGKDLTGEQSKNFLERYFYGVIRKNFNIPPEALARSQDELNLIRRSKLMGNTPSAFYGIPIDITGTKTTGAPDLYYMSDIADNGHRIPAHYPPELDFRASAASNFDSTLIGSDGMEMVRRAEEQMYGSISPSEEVRRYIRPLSIAERKHLSNQLIESYNPHVEQGYAIVRRKGASPSDILEDPTALQLINATKSASSSGMSFLPDSAIHIPEGMEKVGEVHTHPLYAKDNRVMGWGRLSTEDLRRAAANPGLPQYAYELGLGRLGGLVQFGDLSDTQQAFIQQEARENGLHYTSPDRLRDRYGNLMLPSGKNWNELQLFTSPLYQADMALNPGALAPIQSLDGATTGEALRALQDTRWQIGWQKSFEKNPGRYGRFLASHATDQAEFGDLVNPDVRAATPDFDETNWRNAHKAMIDLGKQGTQGDVLQAYFKATKLTPKGADPLENFKALGSAIAALPHSQHQPEILDRYLEDLRTYRQGGLKTPEQIAAIKDLIRRDYSLFDAHPLVRRNANGLFKLFGITSPTPATPPPPLRRAPTTIPLPVTPPPAPSPAATTNASGIDEKQLRQQLGAALARGDVARAQQYHDTLLNMIDPTATNAAGENLRDLFRANYAPRFARAGGGATPPPPPVGPASKGMPDPDETPLDRLANERSPEQNAILMQMAQHSRFALNAGPGVGKTTLMGHWYLSQLIGDQVKPSQIRILTQNNQAAHAFNSHLRNLAGKVGYQLSNTNPAVTAHKFARSLLSHSQGQGRTAIFHMLKNMEGLTDAEAEAATPKSLSHIIQSAKGFDRNQFTVGYNLKDDKEARGSLEWILAHELHRVGAHVAGWSPGNPQAGQYAIDLNDLHHFAGRATAFQELPTAERLAAVRLGQEHLNQLRLTPNGILPESSGGFSNEALFALYHNKKRREGLLDWHDVMYAAATAVRNPLGSFLTNRARDLPTHVAFDETQDANRATMELAKTLGNEGVHLLLAGDPNQAIFTGMPQGYVNRLGELGIGPEATASPDVNFRAENLSQLAGYNAVIAHADALSGLTTPRMRPRSDHPLSWGGRGEGLSFDTTTRNQITAARKMATLGLRNIGLTPQQVAQAHYSGALTKDNWDTWYQQNAKNPLDINSISKQTGLLFQTNAHLGVFQHQLHEMGLPDWLFMKRNADALKEHGEDANRWIHFGTDHSVKGGEFNHVALQVGEGTSGWGQWADSPLSQALIRLVGLTRGAISTHVIAPSQMLTNEQAWNVRNGRLRYQIGPHDELSLGSGQHFKDVPEQDAVRTWRPVIDEYVKQALSSGAPMHEVASHLVSSGVLAAASPRVAQHVQNIHRTAQRTHPQAAHQHAAAQQQAAPVAATVPITLNNATIAAQNVTVTPTGATAGAAAATAAAAANAAATGGGAAAGGGAPLTAGAVAAGGAGFTPPPGVPVNLGGWNNYSSNRNGGGGPGQPGSGPFGAWGRGLARIGWEISYLSQTALQNAQNELMVSDQYRIPAAQQAIMAGTPITPGNISPAGGGLGVQLNSPFAKTYRDFSVAQLQGAQANYASTFNLGGAAAQSQAIQSSPLFNGILQAATLGNMSPQDVAYYVGQAASGISGANSGSLVNNGTSVLNSFLGLANNNLTSSNIAPIAQAYEQIAPIQTFIDQNPANAANLLGLATHSGVSTQDLPIAAQALSSLYSASVNPSTSQQYGLLSAASGLGPTWVAQSNTLEQRALSGQSINVLPMVKSMTQAMSSTGLQLPQLASQLMDFLQKQTQIVQMESSITNNVPGLEISQINAQIGADQASLGAQATNLAYGRASYGFNLNQQNTLYGPIGADASRSAYFGFLNSSAAAGYDWTNANQAGNYAPVQTFGLKNAEFYAGVENQRQQLVLGRSKLTSDLAFQQQMKYLNEQENFYKQELKVQNDERAFQKQWQAKLLDAQAAQLGAQEKLVSVQEALAAAQIPVLQWQQQMDPVMLQLMKDQLAALTQHLVGNGPGPGGTYPTPASMLHNMAIEYKGKSIKDIATGLMPFTNNDAGQAQTLAQMVVDLQKRPQDIKRFQNDPTLKKLYDNFNAAMGGNTTASANFSAAQSNATLGASANPQDLATLNNNLVNLSGWIEKLNETIGGKLNTVTGPAGLLGNVVAPTLMSGASILNILSMLFPGLGGGAAAGGGLGGILSGGLGNLLGIGGATLGGAGLGVGVISAITQGLGDLPGHGGNGAGNLMGFLGSMFGGNISNFGAADNSVLGNWLGTSNVQGYDQWATSNPVIQAIAGPLAGMGWLGSQVNWGQALGNVSPLNMLSTSITTGGNAWNSLSTLWNGTPGSYQHGGGGSKMITFKAGTEGAKQKIGQFFSWLGTQAKNGENQVGGMFSSLGSSVQGGIKNVGTFFSNLGTQARNGQKALASIWSGLGADVVGAEKSVGGFFSNLGSNVQAAIKNVQNIGGNIVWTFTHLDWNGMANSVGNGLRNVMSPGWWSGVFSGIKSGINNVMSNMNMPSMGALGWNMMMATINDWNSFANKIRRQFSIDWTIWPGILGPRPYATGGFTMGGWSLVGEHGAELIKTQMGSQVLNHETTLSKLAQMLGGTQPSRSGATSTHTLNINIEGNKHTLTDTDVDCLLEKAFKVLKEELQS